MTMTKRMQGRPPRDSGINGREKLIEATRAYLRSNRKINLTRSEIAQGCGVTPALISYYFKDKRSLLDAVIKPLMKTYHLQLTAILGQDVPVEDQIRNVIRLFIELNAENPFLVDYMLREAATDGLEAEERSALETFHNSIARLVQSLMQSGLWRQSDPHLAELALWGMCKAFGEAARLPVSQAESPEESIASKVDYVMRTFATGAARQDRPGTQSPTDLRTV